MLEWSCLYDKEMDMYFRAQRQTQCCYCSSNMDGQTLVLSKNYFSLTAFYCIQFY